MPHGGVDEPIDLTRQQRIDGASLDIRIAFGVDDHQRHACGSRDLVGATDHEPAIGRGGDGVADQPDGLARPAAQVARDRVGAVAQGPAGLQDALLGDVGNGAAGLAAEHERDRSGGHAGGRGHVGHQRSATPWRCQARGLHLLRCDRAILGQIPVSSSRSSPAPPSLSATVPDSIVSVNRYIAW